LPTGAELQQTADRLGDAYRTIATTAGVSLRDQIEAYGKWRAAALKASGDVESQHLAEQRVILETRATVAGLGDEYERAMGRASEATRRTGATVREETDRMAAGFRSVAAAADRASISVLRSTKYDAQGFALGADGQRFTAGDGAPAGSASTRAKPAMGQGIAPGGLGQGIAPGGLGQGIRPTRGPLGSIGTAPAEAQAAPASAGRTVNINIAGMGSTSIKVASDADAAKVEAVLRQLETAMGRAG